MNVRSGLAEATKGGELHVHYLVSSGGRQSRLMIVHRANVQVCGDPARCLKVKLRDVRPDERRAG